MGIRARALSMLAGAAALVGIRPMSFMDKITTNVTTAISGKRNKRGRAQYVVVRTSPRFFGTFRPVMPFARIKPKRWRVLERIKGFNGQPMQAIRQCQMPTRDGFLGALPLMFDKRSAQRKSRGTGA